MPRGLAPFALVSLAAVAPAQQVGHVWTRLADAPIPRYEGPMVPIDGRLYVFGGFTSSIGATTTRVDIYDPNTNTWTQGSDLPTAVTHAPLVRDGRKLWLIGGFVGSQPGVATRDVWVYDIDANTWTPGPQLPRPIAAGGAGIIGTHLHYFGGVEIDRDTNTGDHWVLDLLVPQAGWVAAAPMPEPRCHLSGVALNGLLYSLGGQYRHDNHPEDQVFVHVYDPGTGAWIGGPSLPAPRSHAEPGTYVMNGRIYMSGGKSSPQLQFSLSDVFVFDPATQQWTFGVPLPSPRYGCGVQPLGDYVYFSMGVMSFNQPTVMTYRRHKDAVMPNPIRINVGGAEYTSPFDGRVWTGDFLTAMGLSAAYPGVAILGTNDPELFRTQRIGDPTLLPNQVRYRLPNGPGMYRCRCYFADLDNTGAGQRVLDIQVEDRVLADDLDVFATAGARRALSRAFDVQVLDDELDVLFQSSAGRPAIAALELERLAPDHFAHECTSNPNSSGQRARLDFVGSTALQDGGLRLVVNDVPTNTFCILFQGRNPAQQTIPGGVICVGQPQYRHLPVQAQGSSVVYDLALQSPPTPAAQITAGSTWRFQGWFRDGGTTPQWGFSDALRLTFTP